MRKGVSPVVATVLLIAIAVISAVAVWYWVAPLTSAQATPSTSQYGFVVTSTYKNAGGNCITVDVKNSGGVTIPYNTTLEIFNINGSTMSKYVVFNVSALTSGTTMNVNITTIGPPVNATLPVGSYMLRASTKSNLAVSGFTDVYFTC